MKRAAAVLVLLLAMSGAAHAQQLFYATFQDFRPRSADTLWMALQYKSDYSVPWELDTVYAVTGSLSVPLAYVRLGGGGSRDPYWFAWSAVLPLVSLQPGKHMQRVIARDTSGYADTVVHAFKYNRDPPAIVVELPDTAAVYGETVPIRARCTDDAGECTLRLRIVGADYPAGLPGLDTVFRNPFDLPVIHLAFTAYDPNFSAARAVFIRVQPDRDLKDTSGVVPPDLSGVSNLQTRGEWTAFTRRGAGGALEAWIRKGTGPETQVAIGEAVDRLGWLSDDGQLMVVGAKSRWLHDGAGQPWKVCTSRFGSDFMHGGRWFVTYESLVFVVKPRPAPTAAAPTVRPRAVPAWEQPWRNLLGRRIRAVAAWYEETR